MNNELRLRPAQEEILTYRHGRMAISAVPGSGKTFTLSMLATQLIANDNIDIEANQQVLIVTYLNTSVDTFRARIHQRLLDLGLPTAGYDVRTLHSLALEILRWSGDGMSDEWVVLDESQSSQQLATAVDGWIADNTAVWESFIHNDGRETSPQERARWRNATETTAAAFIRAAKNDRYSPDDIQSQYQHQLKVSKDSQDMASFIAHSPLLHMLTGIYERYQSLLFRQGGLDYNDLVWQALERLEQRPDVAVLLRQRWPFVLEDEAQDSVPLQAMLLERLTGPGGNWVRVGDPNQAITSTFTAAHPRFFNEFLDRADVDARTLPNSGRSALRIIGAANSILHWTVNQHPVPEVREGTFREQDILPTPSGDAQPNPPDSEADIRIRVFGHREDEELPRVAGTAFQYATQRPDHTLAILVPTNRIGFAIAEHLDALEADYDNLLRGSGREREIAAALHSVLALLADPLSTKALAEVHAGLYGIYEDTGFHHAIAGRLDDVGHFHTILKSIHLPESALFPREINSVERALPAGVATEEEGAHLETFVNYIGDLFSLRSLPIDDMTLALSDKLFGHRDRKQTDPDTDVLATHELDLAIAYQIASLLRQWREAQPEWRLPELVAQLQLVASGRRRLPAFKITDNGYEPKPGRITLTTQHKAKGLEWDAVFLVGIDGFWIPGTLEASFLGVSPILGGDPQAEAVAQLSFLMKGEAGLHAGRTATDSAHIEVISERLRLFYVGITRARRFLQISRSRSTRLYSGERDAEPATVLGVLYQYLKSKKI